MDHANIGSAMQAVARIYFQSARRTGRTEALIGGLKDGDRIVCPDSKVANDLRRRCAMRAKKIDCVVVSPQDPGRLIERGRSVGRTVFEHSWVEQFYMGALESARLDIDTLQHRASETQEPPLRLRISERDQLWAGY